jgi:AcrR family transcriptional regulator
MRLDGRVRRAKQAREARREMVLQCALRVFAHKGYHATSIADIIESAGIARGTFYLYFPSKRAIFAELLGNLFQLLKSTVRPVDVSAGAEPPMDQLRDIVARVLATLVSHRDLTRILLREAVGLDADFDERLNGFYGSVLELIQHALVTGHELGLVRACETEMTSYCILGSVKELVDRGLSQEGQEVDLGQMASTILGFNIFGLFRLREPEGPEGPDV